MTDLMYPSIRYANEVVWIKLPNRLHSSSLYSCRVFCCICRVVEQKRRRRVLLLDHQWSDSGGGRRRGWQMTFQLLTGTWLLNFSWPFFVTSFANSGRTPLVHTWNQIGTSLGTLFWAFSHSTSLKQLTTLWITFVSKFELPMGPIFILPLRDFLKNPLRFPHFVTLSLTFP